MSATRTPRNPWAPAEDALLAAHYPASSKQAVLDALPGRTWSAIATQADRLDVTRNSPWPIEDEAVMHEHYEREGPTKLAKRLNRAAPVVHKKACRMGLKFCGINTTPRVVRSRAFIGPRLPTKAHLYAVAVAERKAAREKQHRARAFQAAKAAKTGKKAVMGRKPQPSSKPNLEAQQYLVQAKRKVNVPITADDIKKLPYNDPGRMAYTLDGIRGWQAHQSAQAA